MTTDELFEQALDFFRQRGRFAAAKNYWGMAAGQEDELFLAYFDALPDVHKEQTVRILAEIEGGRYPAPEARTSAPGAGALLLKMTFDDGRRRWLHSVQPDMERDFTAPDNLARWAVAEDQEFITGDNYAQGFERAVTLFAILAQLGVSPNVDAALRYLLGRTRSPRLRRVLQINKGMIGIDPRECEMIHCDESDPEAPKVVAVPRRLAGDDGRTTP
jgi:hypothetical protein